MFFYFVAGASRLQVKAIGRKSILYQTKLLNVNRLHHLLAICNRRLLESLTGTKLFHNTCFFKFTLEFLKRSFNVLAFFNLYDNHF